MLTDGSRTFGSSSREGEKSTGQREKGGRGGNKARSFSIGRRTVCFVLRSEKSDNKGWRMCVLG